MDALSPPALPLDLLWPPGGGHGGQSLRLPLADAAERAAAGRTLFELVEALRVDTAARAEPLWAAASAHLGAAAPGAELLLRMMDDGRAVELLVIDGAADPAPVTDGACQSFAVPGLGRVLRAVLRGDGAPAAPSGRFEWGAVTLPHPGETVCGDTWRASTSGASALFAMVDGLGHGAQANRASAAATAVAGDGDAAPERVLERAHQALGGSRGAAAAFARIDLDQGVLRYAGLGNISGVVWGDDARARQMVSHSGIVGHNMRRIQAFDQPWGAHGLLVMHSDGLNTHWRLDAFAGLPSQHPSVIAALLYRGFSRGRDDLSVLVARALPQPGHP